MASVRRKAIGPIFHAGLKSYPRLPIARQLYTGSQKSPLGSEESSLRKTPFIIVDEEIRDAIANKGIGAARPVVALESAIYTHGLHVFFCPETYSLHNLQVSPTPIISL